MFLQNVNEQSVISVIINLVIIKHSLSCSFITVKDRLICANPDDLWVQKAIAHIQ